MAKNAEPKILNYDYYSKLLFSLALSQDHKKQAFEFEKKGIELKKNKLLS